MVTVGGTLISRWTCPSSPVNPGSSHPEPLRTARVISSIRPGRRAANTRCPYPVAETTCVQDQNTVPAVVDITRSEHRSEYAAGVQLRYSYRLYPAPGQRQTLARAFGCARVVFNDGLRARQDAYTAGLPYITDAELSAQLTKVKATPERAWLGEVSAVVLQQALADLNAAYRNFFASVTGQRKGPKIGPPRFRSRKDRRQAIRFTANARWRITPGGKLRLPKIGDIAGALVTAAAVRAVQRDRDQGLSGPVLRELRR
jgi:hypothetical protein